MRKIIAFILIVFCFPAYAETVDRIVAKVGSDIITLSDLKEKSEKKRKYLIQIHGVAEGTKKYNEYKKDALNELILQMLLDQEIKRSGIDIDDKTVNNDFQRRARASGLSYDEFLKRLKKNGYMPATFKEQLKKDMLRQQFIQKKIVPKISISDFELQKEYKKNISKYQEFSKVRFIEVFITPNKVSDAKEREIIAKDIQKKLKLGQSVGSLIKKYSSGAFAAKNGDSGIVEVKTLRPEIRGLLATMQPKETSRVIAVPQGLFIFKLISRHEPKPIPFQKVASVVRSEYMGKVVEKELRKYLLSVKDQTYIEILK